jgi:ZIP family zinc transporter
MNNIAFLITFISSISTLLGVVFIFFNIKKEDVIISSSLAFASGVMLSISLFDLIPEAFVMVNNKFVIVFILFLLGIFISYIIDKYMDKYNDSLYKVGIISFLGLVIHNIPEGIITFITSYKNVKLGLSMGIAIGMHNIPEGISISVPIYYSTKKRLVAFLYTFIASLAEVFGAFITFLFLRYYINDLVMGMLFSFIGGLMIYMSLFELFIESLKYGNNNRSYCLFLFGNVIMLVSILLL